MDKENLKKLKIIYFIKNYYYLRNLNKKLKKIIDD